MKREFKVISPTAILGYGFPEESFERGMEQDPDLIAVDAGSTDPGPFYLGAGKSFTHYESVKRDLDIILPAARRKNIPLVIGTAGGSGGKAHVDWSVDIINEIAQEQGLSFRLGIIYADISRATVLTKLEQKKISPLDGVDELTEDDINNTERIVAQMGHEPVDRALDENCDVILCGRCYDPVPFAAPAVKKGFHRGLAYHMGKILECASIAANPPDGSDSVLGILEKDSFRLRSLNPKREFTRISTAAHSLYEKSDPYKLHGPGGYLDLTESCFKELTNGEVLVTGSRFIPSEAETVKLEGAALRGYRSISIAGARDPIFIRQIDEILKNVRSQVIEQFSGTGHELLFHIYGKNGVMGTKEPLQDAVPHEVGIVIEAVSSRQQQADALCSKARSLLLHYGYPGRISTAGNLAVLYSPSDIECGPVYRFSIYHLMEIEDPLSLFPLKVREVGQ